MKSHELAQKLLSMPNLEVFVESKSDNGTWTMSYIAGHLQDNFTITPSGLFVDFYNSPDSISPNDAPVIGSYMVYFKDETITPARFPGQSRWHVPTVQFLADGEVFTVEYGTYNLEKCASYQTLRMGLEQDIVLSVNDEQFDKLEPIHTEGKLVKRLSDVEYFLVLTSFDEHSWKPTYTEMTYAEALAFGKTL